MTRAATPRQAATRTGTRKKDKRVKPGTKRREVNGWLIIDKPAGLTSAGVVSRVRRATGAAKAGHGGTLDPLATGLLPLALGEATKTVSYVVDGSKTYRFTVRWGEQRDTDDAEGEVIGTSDVRPDAAAIISVLPGFCGEISQVPPIYSAIKVAGERAYALARAERPVDLPARTVHVDRFALVERPDEDHATFEVVAGKGVYMRALARMWLAPLGRSATWSLCGGSLSALSENNTRYPWINWRQSGIVPNSWPFCYR